MVCTLLKIDMFSDHNYKVTLKARTLGSNEQVLVGDEYVLLNCFVHLPWEGVLVLIVLD